MTIFSKYLDILIHNIGSTCCLVQDEAINCSCIEHNTILFVFKTVIQICIIHISSILVKAGSSKLTFRIAMNIKRYICLMLELPLSSSVTVAKFLASHSPRAAPRAERGLHADAGHSPHYAPDRNSTLYLWNKNENISAESWRMATPPPRTPISLPPTAPLRHSTGWPPPRHSYLVIWQLGVFKLPMLRYS